ncbi:MAG TPA: iron ABC transporter permease, partial [Caldimonas sp.]
MRAAMAHEGRAVAAWLALGVVSFALLPWYFLADKSVLQALPAVWGAADSASGALQAAVYGRPWLWVAPIGLAIALVGWRAGSRSRQGALLLAGGLVALLGILVSGFAIGATGWSFAALAGVFGALPSGQPGIGLGGALTLLASLMLLGAGVARLGWVRGDAFTASAIVFCSALLLLFVAFPVARALAGAFVDESGQFSLAALAGRIGNEPTWGLGCLAG